MMIQAPSIARIAKRLLSGNTSILDVAEKSWTVHPAVERMAEPAIFFPEHLDRVSAVQSFTTWDAEWSRIRGGRREHVAAKAYRLRGASLHRGYVYCGAAKMTLETAPESRWLMTNAAYIDDAVMASTYYGNRYFGHALADDIPLTMSANVLGMAVRTERELTPHLLRYRELAGVHAHPLESATFGTLTIVDDASKNDGKRQRYEAMRARFRAGRTALGGAGVVLLRGATGVQRVLRNEAEVQRRLEAVGFRAVSPEGMSADEILDALHDAPIVVGVEGSQLPHGLFAMRDGGTLIAMQPPYRFNNVQKDRADAMGLRYGFVVGSEVDGGFTVDTDDLLRLVEVVQASAPRLQ